MNKATWGWRSITDTNTTNRNTGTRNMQNTSKKRRTIYHLQKEQNFIVDAFVDGGGGLESK